MFLLFYCFFGDKKEKLLKFLLTCVFMPWLYDSFDLFSYSSGSSKIYMPRLLLMCLAVESFGSYSALGEKEPGEGFAWGWLGIGGYYELMSNDLLVVRELIVISQFILYHFWYVSKEGQFMSGILIFI